MGCWRGYLSGARCRLAYGPADATASCFSEIQMVLPFWYRLTWVVPDKGPLNGCMYLISNVPSYFNHDFSIHCLLQGRQRKPAFQSLWCRALLYTNAVHNVTNKIILLNIVLDHERVTRHIILVERADK